MGALGVSADFHDSAVAVVDGAQVVAAVAEERLSRAKHDASMPELALAWCVEEATRRGVEIDSVTFAGKPFTAYERILSTGAVVGPPGFPALARSLSTWTRRKLWAGARLDAAVQRAGLVEVPPIRFAEHHRCHAAAAFFPSPFEHAAILTYDGLGEWTTSSIGKGMGNQVRPLQELRFPHSLGLLYTALTTYCGLEANDGEYKLMGLAPYGEPRFVDRLRAHVVQLHPDGSVELDQRYFAYRRGRSMTSPRMAEILEGPPLPPGAALTQREADIARSAQVVLEDAILSMARHAHELTGERSVAVAGGVALNCVANQRLREDGPFDEVWIQPAAGDDGNALGAALWSLHQIDGVERHPIAPDAMGGALLGPAFSDEEVARWLEQIGRTHRVVDEGQLAGVVAAELAQGAVVGWFQGAMEFGPRALGARSILADPRRADVSTRLNASVKRREGHRPFAPAVLAERAGEWFDLDRDSPYMLFTAPVRQDRRMAPPDREPDSFAARLAVPRSQIPACTHVDGSARVQTVGASAAPRFRALLEAFEAATGCPVLVNTSFNVRGEPIVASPADALRCFDQTDLDLLVLGRCLVPGREAR